MYKKLTKCRACSKPTLTASGIKVQAPKERLVPVFSLGVQPMANDFCPPDGEFSGFAPLEVLLCPQCYLGQLSVTVDPAILYANYKYVTSPSDMMRVHFEKLIADIEQEIGGTLQSEQILEIGSNDGLFLSLLRDRGARVLGVDPATNLVKIASERGIPTVRAGFSLSVAETLKSHQDVIIARHVFCHVDDWHDFLRGLEILSKPETLICIEVPYVRKLLDNTEFDTIYHEHLSYFTLTAMQRLLKDSTLRLHRVLDYSIHGGVILVMLRHKESRVPQDESVQTMLKHEELTDWLDLWAKFSANASKLIEYLKNYIYSLKAKDKTVAGLGASAKSTVWVNACGFRRSDIRFISDCTKQKWFTLSPGTNIPIEDEGAILREMPDYVIVFAWNFLSEVLDKNKLYRSKGGKFIVPVPEVTVV